MSRIAKGKSRVLIIGDTHEPFTHPLYLDFCKRTYDIFKCNTVVHIGDEVDNHAISYHESDPDGMSAGDELSEAKKALKKWYKAFPRVRVCIGNHSALPFRKMKTAGLPSTLLRTYNELLGVPDGWEWGFSWQIDGVLYLHGTGSSGQYAHINRAKENRQSTVIGHAHSSAGVGYLASEKDLIFGMNVGCVDQDTEYLSPTGWKRISEYSGGFVGQYHEDGKVTFVTPDRYIKEPCTYFYELKNQYGLHQVVCKHHRLVYLNTQNKLQTDVAWNLVDRHEKSVNGFGGRFLTQFHVDTRKSLRCSDTILRLLVAIQADGHLIKYGKNKVVMSFMKERKIRRLQMLLRKSRIKYRKVVHTSGVTSMTFSFKGAFKDYPELWYQASEQQLRVISNESLLWDGNQSNQYVNKRKWNVDYIQYAFAASGHRTSIGHDSREGKESYRVTVSRSKLHRSLNVNGKRKIEIGTIPSLDGYKYCFTVPTSMLVLRKNNSIYITGNCGLMIKSYAMEYGKHFAKRPVLGCGVVLEGRQAIFAPMDLGTKIKWL